MPTIHFVTADGATTSVTAEVGSSIMKAAVDNSVDGILAECGGSCSCATCHCYIGPNWADKVPAANGNENGLLEFAVDPKTTSRLSCQVIVTPELDGIIVTLPVSQF